MSKPLTIRSNSGVINSYSDGRHFTVAPDHPAYNKIQFALQNEDFDEARLLSDVRNAVENFVSDPENPETGIKIEDGVFYYKNVEIKHPLVNRILEFMSRDIDPLYLIKFFENMMQNDSRHSINHVFLFLENEGMPLSTDGCFYGWKRVTNEWKDFFSNSVDNSIDGPPVERMERRDVDDNHTVLCSEGYHVGSVSFVSSFNRGTGHVILVKVNPKDVISVPEYDGGDKLRCCFYEKIQEVSPESIGLKESLYSDTAPVVPIGGDNDKEEVWDEMDEEDYSDELPAALALWCETEGVIKEAVLEYLEETDLRIALDEKNGREFVQALHYHAVQLDDQNLITILSNKENMKKLVRLVQGE